MVRPHQRGGIEAARAELRGAITALRASCLLVGARDVQALRSSRPVLLEPLPSWIAQLEPPP
jgi:isopentenyl diphosphate isomerase/L-lactate dehydrogenase-like FMN-dependent dehydrogenase